MKALRRNRLTPPVNPYLKGVVKSIRATIGTVFVFSFFLNLLALTVPIYLLQIYDKVLPNKNADTLTFLTGIVLLAVLTFGALESIRRTLLRKLGVNFDNKISEHLLSSSILRSVKKSSASVSVMRDLANFREFLSGSSMFPILDAPWTPLFIFILYLLHPYLGLVGIVGCVLLFTLALVNEFATRDGVKESSIQGKEQIEHARSYIQNADVIQAMGMQKTVLSDWTVSNKANLAQGYKVSRVNTRLQTISKMLKLILVIAIIFVAAKLILRQELTAGATIASMLLLRRAISPLEQSISSWRSVLKARHAFQNISDYLNFSPSLEHDSSMPDPSGKLVLENVSFRRSGEDKSVLSSLNMSVNPGTISVISGETAAGKSTLIRIMAGILPPTIGKITLGGYELNQWPREQLGPHFGYLPQTTGLFPGTVRFNISRLQDVPVEGVIEAAKLARAHDMIQRLPQGYDTEIDEDATNLSGGQKQKIGLARALYGNPKIVLLDEPDAALDPEGRSALRKTLRELRTQNVAVLLISHHSGILKSADNHYELQDRKLVKQVSQTASKAVDVSKKADLPVSTKKVAAPAEDKAGIQQTPTLKKKVDRKSPRNTAGSEQNVSEQTVDEKAANKKSADQKVASQQQATIQQTASNMQADGATQQPAATVPNAQQGLVDKAPRASKTAQDKEDHKQASASKTSDAKQPVNENSAAVKPEFPLKADSNSTSSIPKVAPQTAADKNARVAAEGSVEGAALKTDGAASQKVAVPKAPDTQQVVAKKTPSNTQIPAPKATDTQQAASQQNSANQQTVKTAGSASAQNKVSVQQEQAPKVEATKNTVAKTAPAAAQTTVPKTTSAEQPRATDNPASPIPKAPDTQQAVVKKAVKTQQPDSPITTGKSNAASADKKVVQPPAHNDSGVAQSPVTDGSKASQIAAKKASTASENTNLPEPPTLYVSKKKAQSAQQQSAVQKPASTLHANSGNASAPEANGQLPENSSVTHARNAQSTAEKAQEESIRRQQALAKEAAIKEAAAKDAAIKDAAAKEVAAREAAAREVAAKEVAAKEASAKETAAREAAAKEVAAKEAAAREAAARETAAKEAAAKEAAAKEAAASEAAAREAAAREAAAREAAAREAAAREAAARETAARESAARETAARETAAREAASKEIAAREAAAREIAAKEAASRELAAREAAAKQIAANKAAARQSLPSQPTAAQKFRNMQQAKVEETIRHQQMLAEDNKLPRKATVSQVDELRKGVSNKQSAKAPQISVQNIKKLAAAFSLGGRDADQ